MLKKIHAIFFVLVCIILGAATAQASEKTYLILLDEITYQNAVHNYNYGSLGRDAAALISKTFNAKAEVHCIDLTNPNDFEPFLAQKYDLIITIGNNTYTLARNAAKENPEQKFALIDFGEAELPPNACAYRFDGSEGAFLAGFLAARMTTTDRLGFIGGMVFPQVQKMEQAFIAGARYAKPGMAVDSLYVNDFFDIEGGRILAQSLYDDGIGIIFHAAGVSGHGVIEAAIASGNLVIGVDDDQYPMAPDNVLTSVVIDLHTAILDVCRAVENDAFPGGRRIIMNLANGGVRLGNCSNVPPEIMETINLVMEGIINNSIAINKTL